MENKKYRGFEYVSICLEDMLSEREQRAKKSRSLAGKSNTTVCMTMNLIGEYKRLPLSHAAFCHFFRLIESALSCDCSELLQDSVCDTAFFTSPLSPEKAKAICEKIEDYGEIGRLFDIDVFNNAGEKLSRSEKRKCLLCEKSASECARSRAHGVDAVRKKTLDILCGYFEAEICKAAEQSLIDEVDTTPKPGLVDRRNSGSHTDMTYNMFLKSAKAISPFFGKLFLLGVSSGYDVTEELVSLARETGVKAELAMLDATGEVNTHKGAIYSLGLLSCGLGYALSGGGSLSDAVDFASRLALSLSYEVSDISTHGIEACRKYGVTGARGEAIGGFKTVLYAFERIKHYADDLLLDLNTAYPLALCDIMAVMSDTNVLHRGGSDALDYMHNEAKEISEMRENQRIDDLYELDDEFIKRNISPGGCADVLACAIYLIKAEKLFAR